MECVPSFTPLLTNFDSCHHSARSRASCAMLRAHPRSQSHTLYHATTVRKHTPAAGHAVTRHRTADRLAAPKQDAAARFRVRHANGTAAPRRAAASSSCSAEFGQCGGAAWSGPKCCAPPHHCYKQSNWYSQCGSGCPKAAAWACQTQPPSLAIIVARWGSWPSWTPLFLHTLRHNPTVDFHLLSDVPPPGTALPAPNVRHHAWSLEQLLARLRETVGVRLNSLHVGGAFASGVSSAKLNDFKPMFGEVFAELLAPYEWWGHLQEGMPLCSLCSASMH